MLLFHAGVSYLVTRVPWGPKVHGLLKIRGEISKSDVVAGLLATKAVQEKLDEVFQVSGFETWEAAIGDRVCLQLVAFWSIAKSGLYWWSQ